MLGHVHLSFDYRKTTYSNRKHGQWHDVADGSEIYFVKSWRRIGEEADEWVGGVGGGERERERERER